MTGGLSPNAVLKPYLFMSLCTMMWGAQTHLFPALLPFGVRAAGGAGRSSPAGRLCAARGHELPR